MTRAHMLGAGLLVAALSGGHAVAQPGSDSPARLKGRVVATADPSLPLRGALVAVWFESGPVHSTSSDRDGVFDVPAPAGRNWSLRITKAGYAPVALEAAALPTDGLVRMTRGAVVTGRVVDRLGAAVPGAMLRLDPACETPCASRPGSSTDPAAAIAETDDLGEYRIGSLVEGTYAVYLAASDVARLALRAATVTPAASPRLAPAVAATVRLRAGEDTTVHLVHEDSEQEMQSTRAFIEAFDPAAIAAALAALGTGSPPPPPGTQGAAAVVRGRVLGPGGGPVSAATVQLIPLDARPPRVVSTDRDGRYELSAIPGAYRLAVSKSGFPLVEYGQQRSQQPGTTIVLRQGVTLNRIDLTMPRGSVISGRVVDAHGEPLEGITVSVLQPRQTGGRSALAPARGVSPRVSDDRGQYRLYGLLPGTYYVTATGPRGGVGGAHTGSGQSPAPLLASIHAPSPSPGGRSLDLSRTLPAAETLIYYPGTQAPSEALPVRIEPEMDRHGADIVFMPASGAVVRGAAVSASGSPAQGSASLSVSHRSGAPAPPPRVSSVGADGSFEFAAVPPGDYVIRLVSRRPSRRSAADAPGQPSLDSVSGASEYGAEFVTVTDAADVTVSMRTRPGASIKGRMMIEGESPASPAEFQLEALPADPDRSGVDTPRLAIPGASGLFVMTDLVGPQRFRLAGAPRGWYLKSAVVHGTDAAEVPVAFDAASSIADDAVLVTVARGGAVSGRASGIDGRALQAYAVAVFSTDPTHWRDRSRHVTLVRSDVTGAFNVAGLPPGEYWVAALELMDGSTEWGDWLDPPSLARLSVGAQRLSLGQGQQVTTHLRAAR